jgi:hypothetical protein
MGLVAVGGVDVKEKGKREKAKVKETLRAPGFAEQWRTSRSGMTRAGVQSLPFVFSVMGKMVNLHFHLGPSYI